MCTGDREQLRAQVARRTKSLNQKASRGEMKTVIVVLGGLSECMHTLAMQLMRKPGSWRPKVSRKARLAGAQHRVQANAEEDVPP